MWATRPNRPVLLLQFAIRAINPGVDQLLHGGLAGARNLLDVAARGLLEGAEVGTVVFAQESPYFQFWLRA
jgi:hypothetical protein